MSEASRPAWTEVRARLDALGFRPSRRFGQNFLLDENMVRRIARDAEIGAGDVVLEVGAGCGFLSAFLAAEGVRLLAVEIDPRLVEVSRGVLEPWPEAEVLHADALAGKHALAPEVDARLPEAGPWHLVGNLPYSIASPLFVVLARRPNPPATMTALVQAEVADRVVAEAGTPDRGPLSVRLQAHYRARKLRRVPPQLFWPRPKVDSAVVRLELRDAGERPDDALWGRLDALVGVLFGQRRKAVGGLLTRYLDPEGGREATLERLRALGIDPASRAADLPLDRFLELARALPELPPEGAGSGGGRGGRS